MNGDPQLDGIVAMGAAIEAKATHETPPPPEGWPKPIGGAAYHGVVGEFVRQLEPHTEGDPSSILVQTLVALGNVAGRESHFMVSGSRHGTNLFAVVVGESSRARKGTSYASVEALASRVDAAWAERNAGEGGLSTPEGLISVVRDAREINGKQDPGITDKRFLAAMGEFAELLSKMKREDNPLSAVLRSAWDGRPLRTRTVGNPMTATGAHVSVVAHITETELDTVLVKSDISNGFGNRFLWVLARRWKLLPHGGSLNIEDLPAVIRRVSDALAWAGSKDRNVKFSATAMRRWERVYSELGQQGDGKVGAVTSRSESQVRRIALVYAVLDKSPTVKPVHLEAALEVRRYCEESAAYIFGDERETDQTAIRIKSHLRKRATWVTKTQINKFLKTVPSYALDRTLEEMIANGTIEERQTPTRGRPKTEYRIKLNGREKE